MMLKTLFFFLLFIFRPFDVFAQESSTQTDTEYAVNQQTYNALGADQAYALGFTGSGVTVAVVDNGTLTSHQELADQFSELQLPEYNIQDSTDHGTAVSSLIAGKKDGTGMHGIAYDAKILAFSVDVDDGVDCPTCYQSYVDAWKVLATDTFDGVKIINNSIGNAQTISTYTPTTDEISTAKSLVAKDKLIVASAGNETSLSPTGSPAGLPYYDSTLKYNFISAIAYDPTYSVASPYFLASYSNLALGAQEWSLAAPVGSLTAASGTGDSAYAGFSGTSAAAPVISAAAAIVSNAFPYLGGKQIADVLFSTADKNYASFSKYMIQKDNGITRFLFFGTADGYGKEWTDTEKQAVVRAELGGSYLCSSSGVFCEDVTYSDVFGQGIINLANAVKGPGYLDANRLNVTSDFADNQYFYTVNVQTYDSVWSNNIAQVKSKTDKTSANVGLKKQGTGTLTLSGQNTYLGTTLVQEGTLRLTGSLAADVSVESGIFYLNGGTVYGNVLSQTDGQISADAGTFSSLTNLGTANVSGGTVNSADNKGEFYLTSNGIVSGSLTNSGNFYLNGGVVSGNISNSGQFYLNGGTLGNTVQNTGTVQNNTFLKEGLVIGGTLINQAGGSLYLTSSPDTLTNYGKIVLSPSEQDPSVLQQMTVSTLNLTGGGFALDMNNLPELAEGRSYLVFQATNTFNVGADFETSNRLSQFVIAQTQTDNAEKTVSVALEYLPLSSASYAPNLTTQERQTAAVIDRLFKNETQNDFAGYYFLDESNLKKQINKMNAQVKPVHFSSLPLSNKLGRTVQTHLFERQSIKNPYQYEGRREYYAPSSSDRIPRYDVYRNYRPGSRVRENYNHAVPRTNDVYRNYRPGNTPQENYRYYVPRNRDVYRHFRPSGRSGGQNFGSQRNVWGQLLYAQGTYESDQPDQDDAEGDSIGLMFGWDFVYSKDFLWGLTAGYAQSSIDQDKDSTEVTDLRFGAYFSTQKDFLSIDGILMIGLQGYDKKRVTTLPLKSFEHQASFNGTSIEAALNVGYDIQQIPMNVGDWSLRPYIGVTLTQMTQDAYDEKGQSDLNLSVKDVKDTSLTVSPGLIAGFVTADTNFMLFRPEYIFFDLRYDHYLTGGTPSSTAYFSADTLQTMFESPQNEEDSAFTIGIGINGRLSTDTRLNLLFSQRSGSKSSIQSISATVIHSF